MGRLTEEKVMNQYNLCSMYTQVYKGGCLDEFYHIPS